jgi:hypothetical protein
MAAILHRAGCELRTGAEEGEALLPCREPKKAINKNTITRIPISNTSTLPEERLDGVRPLAIRI